MNEHESPIADAPRLVPRPIHFFSIGGSSFAIAEVQSISYTLTRGGAAYTAVIRFKGGLRRDFNGIEAEMIRRFFVPLTVEVPAFTEKQVDIYKQMVSDGIDHPKSTGA